MLSPFDNVPDFADPDLTGRHVVNSGSSRWSVLYGESNHDKIIRIESEILFDLAYADAHTIAIMPGGHLKFVVPANGEPQLLEFVNLLVHPGGKMHICADDGGPYPGQAALMVRDAPLELPIDPHQYGTGILCAGEIKLVGQPKTSWARLESSTATSFTFESDLAGWGYADQLVVPVARQLNAGQSLAGYPFFEDIYRLARLHDARTIEPSPSPSRSYFMQARDGTLMPVPVANLTRSIRVLSANPTGTRGHVMFLRDADVHLSHVEFRGLGRTTVAPVGSANQIGRYAVHFHHCYGSPGRRLLRFSLIGCSVHNDGALDQGKWGIVLHDSHSGQVVDNVVYGYPGAGIVTEDGSESYNDIARNLVIRCAGVPGQDPFLSDFGDTEGNHGSGFWFRAANNYIADNMAFGCRRVGFVFETKDLKTQTNIPASLGDDPRDTSTQKIVRLDKLPPLLFRDNTAICTLIGHSVYGASSPAFSLSHCTSWYASRSGFQAYYASVQISLSHCEIYAGTTRGGSPVGMQHDVYSGLRMIGGTLIGCAIGARLVGWQSSKLENVMIDCDIGVLHVYGTPTNNSSRIEIVNCKFEPGTIAIKKSLGSPPAPFGLNRLLVTDYNQTPGNNFAVHFHQQSPEFVIPPWMSGAAQTGVTHRELQFLSGQAIAGELAPDTAGVSRPEIDGLV